MGRQQFDYTGAAQTFIAPAAGTYHVQMWGADGGSTSTNGDGGGALATMPGGKGGYSECDVVLTNGQSVQANVGGAGGVFDLDSGWLGGGWNGGGDFVPVNVEGVTASAGGGGASDIRLAGTALANRKLVAAGGGGAGYLGYCKSWAAVNKAVAGGPGGGLVAPNAPIPRCKIPVTLQGTVTGGTVGITLPTPAWTWDAATSNVSPYAPDIEMPWNATPAQWQAAIRAQLDPTAVVTGTAGKNYLFDLAPFPGAGSDALIGPYGNLTGPAAILAIDYASMGEGFWQLPGLGADQTGSLSSRQGATLGVGGTATSGNTFKDTAGNSVMYSKGVLTYTGDEPGVGPPFVMNNKIGELTLIELGDAVFYGGGGGGGYWGGGAGAGNVGQTGGVLVIYEGIGGGAGGSAYIDPTVTNGLTDTGAASHPKSGTTNGRIIITWVDAPTKPTNLAPNGGTTVVAGADQLLTWQPNFPSSTDSQSSANVYYKHSTDPTYTEVANAATTASSYVLPGANISNGVIEDWYVEVKGSTGLLSPTADVATFVGGAAPGAPTITAPLTGAVVSTLQQPVTFTPPAGYVSAGYQFRRTSDTAGTIVYWLGAQTITPALTGTVQMDAVSGRNDHLQVRFTPNGSTWSPWAEVVVDSELGPPSTPLVTAQQISGPDGEPWVRVRVTNPPTGTNQSPTVSNDLYRTYQGVETRIATGLGMSASFVDQRAGFGDNTYRVLATAANGQTASSITGGTS